MVHHPPAGEGLLGTHIAQGPQQIAGQGQGCVALELGQAEVRHPQLAADVHQQVARFDVAVDHSQLVGVFQGLGRLQPQLGRQPAELGLGGDGTLRQGGQVTE